MQINLEHRITLVVLVAFMLQSWFASTSKYSWLCPWLFKWPDYEEEYNEDGAEDVYAN